MRGREKLGGIDAGWSACGRAAPSRRTGTYAHVALGLSWNGDWTQKVASGEVAGLRKNLHVQKRASWINLGGKINMRS